MSAWAEQPQVPPKGPPPKRPPPKRPPPMLVQVPPKGPPPKGPPPMFPWESRVQPQVPPKGPPPKRPPPWLLQVLTKLLQVPPKDPPPPRRAQARGSPCAMATWGCRVRFGCEGCCTTTHGVVACVNRVFHREGEAHECARCGGEAERWYHSKGTRVGETRDDTALARPPGAAATGMGQEGEEAVAAEMIAAALNLSAKGTAGTRGAGRKDNLYAAISLLKAGTTFGHLTNVCPDGGDRCRSHWFLGVRAASIASEARSTRDWAHRWPDRAPDQHDRWPSPGGLRLPQGENAEGEWRSIWQCKGCGGRANGRIGDTRCVNCCALCRARARLGDTPTSRGRSTTRRAAGGDAEVRQGNRSVRRSVWV
jgi:hypothetical protein